MYVVVQNTTARNVGISFLISDRGSWQWVHVAEFDSVFGFCVLSNRCVFIQQLNRYCQTEVHYIEEEGRNRSKSLRVNHGQCIWQMTFS